MWHVPHKTGGIIMAEENKTVFDLLNAVNVNEHVEQKNTGKTSLSYLSWTWAWAEVKKRYPDAHYEIKMFDGKPYVYDSETGYMCFTTVTIENITHEMWLPVMDSHNDAMMNKPYEVTTSKGFKYTVNKATMFDINKTIMRCLTKNLAMFGLGLYIYAGEDLPTEEMENQNKEIEEINALMAKVGKVLDSDNNFNEQQKKYAYWCMEHHDKAGLQKIVDSLEEKKTA